MKKRLAVLIALLLAASLFLSGCTPEDALEFASLLTEYETYEEGWSETVQEGWDEADDPDDALLTDYETDQEDWNDADDPDDALLTDYETNQEDWGEPLEFVLPDEDGHYSSKSEVGLYLYLYGHLPDNYLTKKEAQNLGWSSKEGNLWDVAPGMSIGGDRFGNYEGLLPDGKTYYECDVDYGGGYRSGERIVFSTDGYIYYTEDHYETFTQLYP